MGQGRGRDGPLDSVPVGGDQRGKPQYFLAYGHDLGHDSDLQRLDAGQHRGGRRPAVPGPTGRPLLPRVRPVPRVRYRLRRQDRERQRPAGRRGRHFSRGLPGLHVAQQMAGPGRERHPGQHGRGFRHVTRPRRERGRDDGGLLRRRAHERHGERHPLDHGPLKLRADLHARHPAGGRNLAAPHRPSRHGVPPGPGGGGQLQHRQPEHRLCPDRGPRARRLRGDRQPGHPGDHHPERPQQRGRHPHRLLHHPRSAHDPGRHPRRGHDGDLRRSDQRGLGPAAPHHEQRHLRHHEQRARGPYRGHARRVAGDVVRVQQHRLLHQQHGQWGHQRTRVGDLHQGLAGRLGQRHADRHEQLRGRRAGPAGPRGKPLVLRRRDPGRRHDPEQQCLVGYHGCRAAEHDRVRHVLPEHQQRPGGPSHQEHVPVPVGLLGNRPLCHLHAGRRLPGPHGTLGHRGGRVRGDDGGDADVVRGGAVRRCGGSHVADGLRDRQPRLPSAPLACRRAVLGRASHRA